MTLLFYDSYHTLIDSNRFHFTAFGETMNDIANKNCKGDSAFEMEVSVSKVQVKARDERRAVDDFSKPLFSL